MIFRRHPVLHICVTPQYFPKASANRPTDWSAEIPLDIWRTRLDHLWFHKEKIYGNLQQPTIAKHSQGITQSACVKQAGATRSRRSKVTWTSQTALATNGTACLLLDKQRGTIGWLFQFFCVATLPAWSTREKTNYVRHSSIEHSGVASLPLDALHDPTMSSSLFAELGGFLLSKPT